TRVFGSADLWLAMHASICPSSLSAGIPKYLSTVTPGSLTPSFCTRSNVADLEVRGVTPIEIPLLIDPCTRRTVRATLRRSPSARSTPIHPTLLEGAPPRVWSGTGTRTPPVREETAPLDRIVLRGPASGRART